MTPQIISAVPVPFDSTGEIDRDGFAATLEAIAPHVDAALVAGTTGEFPALDDSERLELFTIAAGVLGAERTIAHVGHASSRQVLRLAGATVAAGIRRLALLNPYYLPADDDAVVDFFAALSTAVPSAEVYAYLFPERTGIDVAPQTLARILALPGMRGVKLSGAAAARLPEYVAVVPDGQEVFSGDDGALPWVMENGGAGVVSGVSSAFPEIYAELARALAQGSPDAERVQEQVRGIVPEVGPTITRLKAAMRARYGGSWESRMALPAVAPAAGEAITSLVTTYR